MTMETMPYLFFDGNCAEALAFYERNIGAEISGVMRNSDAPDAEYRMPGGDDIIMNAFMKIGGSSVMASDSGTGWYQKPQGFAVYLETPSVAEAERVFAALSDGGAIQMPLGPTFWAERFGMVTDRFGIPWMVAFTGSVMAG
jgi:PhnB protein